MSRSTAMLPVLVLLAVLALSHFAHVVQAGGSCGLVRENVLARGKIISIADKAPSDNSYFCCNKCYEVPSCVGFVETKARCTLLRSIQRLDKLPSGGDTYYNTVLMTGRGSAM